MFYPNRNARSFGLVTRRVDSLQDRLRSAIDLALCRIVVACVAADIDVGPRVVIGQMARQSKGSRAVSMAVLVARIELPIPSDEPQSDSRSDDLGPWRFSIFSGVSARQFLRMDLLTRTESRDRISPQFNPAARRFYIELLCPHLGEADLLVNPVPATPASPQAGTTIAANTPVVVRLIYSADSSHDSPGREYRASLDEPLVNRAENLWPRAAPMS